MKKVFLFSIFLLCGLFFSQILPSALGSVYGTLASISKWLMFICLAFIMINVGREFELDKAKWAFVHDGLFYCHGDGCRTLALDSLLLYLFSGYGIVVGE